MKKGFGLLVILLAFGLVLVGCSNPSDGNGNESEPQIATYISTDSAGNRYTLEITENTSPAALYAAQTGDSFVLTVELFSNDTYTLALSYSGTIDNSQTSGTELILKLSVNGEELTITISGTAMTVISGTIILDDEQEMAAPDTVTPIITDVYVAGSYGAGIPCYWKNGVKTDLPVTGGGYRGSASKIIVDGTDIYVLGYIDNGSQSFGCYWKTGNLTLLPNNGYAGDFALSNGVLYIAGSYEVTVDNLMGGITSISKPYYWRNGTKTDLNIPDADASLYSIYFVGPTGTSSGIAVAGTTVYITGYYYVPTDVVGNGFRRGCYWINGNRTDLPQAENDCWVEGIAVNGSDVFLTGWFEGTPRHSWLYKNGMFNTLPSGTAQDSMAYDIAASGDDVYIAGFSGNGSTRQASYWKNFTLNMLPVPGTNAGKDSFANGITVINDDVYIAGSVNVFYDFQGGNSTSTACYWKNGVRVDLLDNAGANDIFVVVN